MSRTRTLVLAVSTAVLVVTTAASPARAAMPPLPPPPSPQDQVRTTNAMLQLPDLTGPLAPETTAWSGGFTIPAGGEDPMWLCRYRADRYIHLPGDTTLQYDSAVGRVTQNVYVYESETVAAAALAQTRTRLAATCSGTWDLDTWRTRLSWGDYPVGSGPTGVWVRSDAVKGTATGNSSMYVTVVPVGNALNVVWLDAPMATTTRGQRQALDSLASTLATRLDHAASLPVTQSDLLTKAQTDMLQPSDVPAALPLQTPAQGGWSIFEASTPGLPGESPDGSTLRAGIADFTSNLAANEGSQPGSLWQEVTAYPDEASAQAAWRAFRTSILRGTKTPHAPLSSTKPTTRLTTGESTLVVDGTAGLWSRWFQSLPAGNSECRNDAGTRVPCLDMSNKRYSIYLLVGSTIQSASYSATVDELADMPLDQLAVNQLAEQLALRWAAA